jgi:hypothetical protein
MNETTYIAEFILTRRSCTIIVEKKQRAFFLTIFFVCTCILMIALIKVFFGAATSFSSFKGTASAPCYLISN